MKKYILDLVVTQNTRLHANYVLIKMTHANPLPEMVPGQFAEIRIDGSNTTFLRRPISINFVDKEANEVWFLVQLVGDGTRKLATVKEGDVLNTWDGILTWDDGFYIKTGPVAYYTLQGNTDGKVGIQVHLCPDENDSDLHPRPYYYVTGGNNKAIYYLASEWEAEQVLEIFNNNRAAWDRMMETMLEMGRDWYPKEGSGTTGNAEFLINFYEQAWAGIHMKCLDFDDDDDDGIKGSIRGVNGYSPYKYRYIRVKVYNPVN